MKLSTKQQRFVEAYDGNATQAALVAGYSAKTAPFIGAENLKKPQICQAIQEREEQEARARIAPRQKRQAFWTAVMLDESQEMRDRLRASELLGKSEGDFLERHEMTGVTRLSADDCARRAEQAWEDLKRIRAARQSGQEGDMYVTVTA